MYRGGLYAIGYSHRLRKIIYLAVERIRKADKLAERFTYPKAYSPQKHTEGIFGMIDGLETRVELPLLNADTAAYLSSRRLHPTQRFTKQRDGNDTAHNDRARDDGAGGLDSESRALCEGAAAEPSS